MWAFLSQCCSQGRLLGRLTSTELVVIMAMPATEAVVAVDVTRTWAGLLAVVRQALDRSARGAEGMLPVANSLRSGLQAQCVAQQRARALSCSARQP